MTTDILQEYTNCRGVPVRVDRQFGVIRGVKVLGLESRNGRTYLPETLSRAATLYENAKVNVNHPKGNPTSPRDYQDRIGSIRNVVVRPNEGLFGDFYFNPKHALAEQLIWDAENAPENVGFSHNVEARVRRDGERIVVEEIVRVQSVDLVADPATTRGLFEANEKQLSPGDDATETAKKPLSLEIIKRDYPELVEEIRRNESAERIRLQEEVSRLTALVEKHRKRALVCKILREFELPDPEYPQWWAKTMISEEFLEFAASAPDEEAMRAIIKERAQLVWKFSKAVNDLGTLKPMCRDQGLISNIQFSSTRSFVEAIT